MASTTIVTETVNSTEIKPSESGESVTVTTTTSQTKTATTTLAAEEATEGHKPVSALG